MSCVAHALAMWLACLASGGHAFRVRIPSQRPQSSGEAGDILPSSAALTDFIKPQREKGDEVRNVLRKLLLASNLDSSMGTRVPAPPIGRRSPVTQIKSPASVMSILVSAHFLYKVGSDTRRWGKSHVLDAMLCHIWVPICFGAAAWLDLVKHVRAMWRNAFHRHPEGSRARPVVRQRSESPEVGGTGGAESLWLNTIFSELWPKIAAFVERLVKESIEPGIQAALPHPLDSAFHISEITLGDTPMLTRSIVASPVDYQGRNGLVRDIHVKVDFSYHGSAYVSISALGTKLGIQNIEIDGVLTIALQELLDDIPFFSGMSVFFVNPPSISMSWVGVTSILNLFKRQTRNIIRKHIEDLCVLPKRIAFVVNTTEPETFRIKAPRPPGCLRLRLLAARNLKGLDWHLLGNATSDPYAKFSIGGHEHRSKIVHKTCDPEWNEEFTLLVSDQDQKIHMNIMDADIGPQNDDFLGFLSMSVADILARCDQGPTWFPLGPDEEVDAEATVQGEVQLAADWMPISVNQRKANAIEVPSSAPQALLFLGVHSLKVPPATVGTSYQVEVSCNGTVFTTAKTSAAMGRLAESAELRHKIAKLQSLKVTDEDIAEILSVPIEDLNEEQLSAAKYSSVVTVEEPFLWLIDVPKNTTINLVVSQGGEKLASLPVHVAECLKDEECTQRQTLKDGKVEVDLITQVRVITEA